MSPFFSKAIGLLLLSLFSFVLAQSNDADDGYIGYRLDKRGDPESVTYETADTDAGGVPLSQIPDVYLNANVSVDEISIEVDNITAKVNLDAQVLKLLHFTAGVDASIDRVKLTIQNVSAKVELEARLENVVQMVGDVLNSIDLNPIIATLGQDVAKIVNGTVGIIENPVGSTTSTSTSTTSKRSLDYQVENNILYSMNDYTGSTHTNRMLAQNGSIYDQFLDNFGHDQGQRIVGYYARDMTFNGHNRTIILNGKTEYELEYVYTPFAGLEAVCNIFLDTAGKVIKTQVIAEAQGGGTSTVSEDKQQ